MQKCVSNFILKNTFYARACVCACVVNLFSCAIIIATVHALICMFMTLCFSLVFVSTCASPCVNIHATGLVSTRIEMTGSLGAPNSDNYIQKQNTI